MKTKTKFRETHRGIPTTRQRLHERKPKTITNRFKTLSLSLPRIDNKKRWAGFPGLTGVSRLMAKFTPVCKYYLEPFAGTAKVYQELLKLSPLKFEQAILNDNSDFIYEWMVEVQTTNVMPPESPSLCKVIDRWKDRINIVEIDQSIVNVLYPNQLMKLL